MMTMRLRAGREEFLQEETEETEGAPRGAIHLQFSNPSNGLPMAGLKTLPIDTLCLLLFKKNFTGGNRGNGGRSARSHSPSIFRVFRVFRVFGYLAI